MHTTPTSPQSHRPAPRSRDAIASEEVLLSVALHHPEQVDRLRAEIPPEAFEEPMHAELFRALLAIRDAGNTGFTLAAIHREMGDAAGGYDELKRFLERLMGMFATPGQLDYDLGVVRSEYERRACVLALQQTIYELTHDRVSAHEALDRPREHFARLGAKDLRALSGSSRGLSFVTLDRIEPTEEPDWVWPGYAACGCITVLSAAPKAGKSTLLRGLLHDLYRGGPLAPDCPPMTAPTLIVSEETPGHWARQATVLDLPRELVHLCAQPFFTKPTLAQWEQAVAKVAQVVEDLKPRLVIFDTLSNLWPVRDENSAAEVNAALMPLRAISATGAALILVHHDRKSGGSHGENTRGSSAIGGFPDALVQLRRFRDKPEDTRRKLSYVGRFEKAPAEVIIDLTDDGYRTLGTSNEVESEHLLDRIASVLPEEGPGLTVAEVRERVGIGTHRLRDLLADCVEQGLAFRTGSGRRSDPFLFGRTAPRGSEPNDLLSGH
ncbi:MAG: AAA family ATPase [Phycisphaerales bacterium JB065]